jgi:hypothetical protein
MSGSVDKSSGSKSFPSVQMIVLAEITWAVLALLFFLLFSATTPGQSPPVWYSWGTSIFEIVAFLTAAILCFRNYRSSQIVSGRNVWLGIGLGMLFYGIGSMLFTYWEVVLGIEPDISPGDFFYVLTYIFLTWGMALAVLSRRLNLLLWQWLTVGGIAIIGVALAVSLGKQAPEVVPSPQSWLQAPAIAQAPPAAPAKPSPAAPAKASPKAPVAKPTGAGGGAQPAATSAPKGQASPAAGTEAAEPEKIVPAWASSMEDTLRPLKPALDWLYVVGDVCLLVIATTLLLAFWGGRFSQSWKVIAAAAFSLYIADIWFKYATNNLENYQSGSLPEVFWVFSGVLFGIGAALEYDLSSRSRRTGRRRS